MNFPENLKQYALKKGFGYFISNPSEEDKVSFLGLFFDKRGLPILCNMYSFYEMKI